MNISKLYLNTQTFASCTDMRITGSKLKTGKKMFVDGAGYGRGYTLYMSNDGKSVQFYIMFKGKRSIILHDRILNVNLHNLNEYGHYIELN
ncbi:MAG: hypothetical protein MJH10_11445 [Epibacterium sp.]|nr:hypothetical protein [Epibacterium sp.]NQX74161.1 hypothetical protein [Epibacterium sp.]